MNQSIACVTLVVHNYDEAIAYFTKVLGFTLMEDTQLSESKRWVVVAPRGGLGTSLVLAQAANSRQAGSVGNQTGGSVSFILHTDDFADDYEIMKSRGVRFLESPREESYGTVALFEDIYGNRWDLLKLKSSNPAR